MLKALIFDFDGIVVDSEPLHHRAYLRVLEPFGVDFDYHTYEQRYIAFDDRDNFRRMSADFGFKLDDAGLATLIEAKAHAFETITRTRLTPYPGVIELMRSASARMPVAICSGAVRSDIEAILPALAEENPFNWLRAVVTADDVARSKPDPACYALTAKKLGIDPASCVAIEDTPPGLAAARGAGMRTVAVTNSFGAAALAGKADRIVASLKDVTVDTLRDWFA
jgi:beta-phosphoglucomutase